MLMFPRTMSKEEANHSSARDDDFLKRDPYLDDLDLDGTRPHGPDINCSNFSLGALVDRYQFLRHFKLHGFARLLFRWKASVYKLLWREMLVFLLFYAIVSVIYRYALYGHVKTDFEKLSLYAYDYTKVFPISFVLGFYVTVVFDRWWTQFKAIPWPDRVVYNISAHIQGCDDEARMIRRTLVRYINLSAILIFRAGSKRVRKRFPTLAHVVEAGLMTEEEKEIWKSIPTQHPKYWVPCVWFINLIRLARKQGRIQSDPAMKTIVDELNNFRDKCDELYGFDWIVVPLVYTQVVTIATYSYFVACIMGSQYLEVTDATKHHTSIDMCFPGFTMLEFVFYVGWLKVVTIATYSYFVACTIGRQYLDPNSEEVESTQLDLYFPGFTLLEFVFYVGWLKVAENLMNPFGEDDDDFDMNTIVDRNLEISFLAVDDLYEVSLPLVRDRHFEVSIPEIPYTNAAVKSRGKPWQGSASRVRLSRRQMAFTSMPHKVFTEEDETIDCKLQNYTTEVRSNQDGSIQFGPEIKFSKYASQKLQSVRGQTDINPPPDDRDDPRNSYDRDEPRNTYDRDDPRNSLPPGRDPLTPKSKLSRSTGERRRDLPRNRRMRQIPDEPHYEEPVRPPSERIDIDIRRMNSDHSDCDDDHCTPLNCPVDLTQIVNESVI